MAVLTAPTKPVELARETPRASSLRYRRVVETGWRTIELSPGKCTVGSSPQCHLCLPTPDVQPLQCLITSAESQTTVTRWSAGVQLNGRDFAKATIVPGDRLTVGLWEIEFGGESGSELAATADLCFPADIAAACDEAPSAAFEPAAESEPACEIEPPAGENEPTEVVGELAADVPGESAGDTAVAVIVPSATHEPSLEPLSAAHEAAANRASCVAFEDRLVLHLWTANHQARRRGRALINSIRAARFQADAMAADLSAMETELDLARAAYDLHLGNDHRLQQELDEQREETERRVGALEDEINQLRTRLVESQDAMASHANERVRLLGELELLKDASATGQHNAEQMAQLEEEIAELTTRLNAVTDQLQQSEAERQRLNDLYSAECARAAQLQAELSAPATAAVPTTVEAASDASVEAAGDPWANVAPLDVCEPAAEPAEWNSFDAISSAAGGADDCETEARPSEAACRREEPAAEAAVPAAGDLQVASESKASVEAPSWAVQALETPAGDFKSTSFIDRYRHLLDDEDDAAPSASPPPLKALLDDEYLSPSKVQTCAKSADDSDDALEAYMANMMRRVRSNGPSYSVGSQIQTTAVPAWRQEAEAAAAAPAAIQEMEPEAPLSSEELRMATKKVPLSSDLAALREIANSSARTAIQTHSQRQGRETAITRLIVAVTATVSAGYLMASAPAIGDWQFWAGAVTCVVGLTAAAQVIVMERRARR